MQPETPHFLSGGGEMGALMRAHDWSRSSLGAPSTWPQPLRTAVRLLLNTGHPMYIYWGPDGACLYNDAYRESIGPERHPHSLGRPAREVWGEIWEIIGPQIEQVMSGNGATWHVNHLVPITRHGRREDVYWTYSYSPIDDETARLGVGGVLVVCSETTQQIRMTQELEAERDKLTQLFEQSPVFMAMLSGPEHRFELINPGYRQLIGHRAVLGKTVVEGLPEAAAQGYVALLEQVYSTGIPYVATGARYMLQLDPDGPTTQRVLDFAYQPIKNRDGQVTGIFVQGVDVTHRAEADAALTASEARFREMTVKLTEANRLKDEFLATLSHELRTPLNAILGYVRMLQKEMLPPDRIRRAHHVVERNATALQQIVEDVLDVSRIVSGHLRLNLDVVDLAAILHDSLASVLPSAEEKSVRVDAVLAPVPGVISGDGSRLQQIIWNLLTNAVKFTPEGGHIEVRLTNDVTHVTVTVTDSGQGIDPAFMPFIFDRFRQADASLTRQHGGLGLGLAIARHLAELHGGTLVASSDGIGKGAAFTLTLPMEQIGSDGEADSHGIRLSGQAGNA